MITCEGCGALTPKGTRGPTKRFCSTKCRQSSNRKHPLLTHCIQCKKPLEQNKNNTRRSCSRVCRDRLRAEKQKALRQRDSQCERCQTPFTTGKKSQRYCSAECRQAVYKDNYTYTPRTEPKILTCGWCGEDVVVAPNFTSGRKYHDNCKIEARRARYRIKTVRRQSLTVNPSRLAADEVVRVYGSDCHICQEPIDLGLPRTHKQGLTVDHVIPLSKGGTDTINNMKPAHWLCNIKKGNKLYA